MAVVTDSLDFTCEVDGGAAGPGSGQEKAPGERSHLYSLGIHAAQRRDTVNDSPWYRKRGLSMFKIVVVGADDSPTARRAIEAATEIVLMSAGVLHLVTAFESKSRAESSLPHEFRNTSSDGEAEAALQALSFVVKKRGIEPVLHMVQGDPSEAIVRIADEVNADLIVVENRGMKGARRVLGSVPNSVAHGANCSVAIIDTTE